MDFKKLSVDKKWPVGIGILIALLLLGGISFWAGANYRGIGFGNPQGQGNFSQMRGDFQGMMNDQGSLRQKNSGRMMDGGLGDERFENRRDDRRENMPNPGSGMGLGRTIEGKIVSIDGNNITIETENGTKSITLSDEATIERIVASNSSELNTDSQIVVVLDGPVNSDSLTADKIQIKN